MGEILLLSGSLLGILGSYCRRVKSFAALPWLRNAGSLSVHCNTSFRHCLLLTALLLTIQVSTWQNVVQ